MKCIHLIAPMPHMQFQSPLNHTTIPLTSFTNGVKTEGSILRFLISHDALIPINDCDNGFFSNFDNGLSFK